MRRGAAITLAGDRREREINFSRAIFVYISRALRTRLKRTARGVTRDVHGFHARTSPCSYGGRVTLHRAMRYTRQRFPAWIHVSARERTSACTDRRRFARSRSFFFFFLPRPPRRRSRSASTRGECENFYPERDAVAEMEPEKGNRAEGQIFFSSPWRPRLKYNGDKNPIKYIRRGNIIYISLFPLACIINTERERERRGKIEWKICKISRRDNGTWTFSVYRLISCALQSPLFVFNISPRVGRRVHSRENYYRLDSARGPG